MSLTIYRTMLSELSNMCSCKWRILTKWFDKLARCRRGKCDKLFVGLLRLAKMWNIIDTLCLLYKVFKTNVMCGTRRPKSIRTSREEEIMAYDELLQIERPKEVKPLLYCLIELIQNSNFLNFAANFQRSSSTISSQYVPGFTFVESFSAEVHKFD